MFFEATFFSKPLSHSLSMAAKQQRRKHKNKTSNISKANSNILETDEVKNCTRNVLELKGHESKATSDSSKNYWINLRSGCWLIQYLMLIVRK